MADKTRSRLWCVLLYPDDPTHADALEIIRKEFQYVGILHDQDTWTADDEAENSEHKAGELKKPHYHIILKFTQARWSTALADDLGIKPNYLEQCRNFDTAALYLVHDGLYDKFQYDYKTLEGPLVPAVMKLLAASDEGTRVTEIIKLIDSMGFIDYRDLVLAACQNGMYSDLRRMGSILHMIVNRHNEIWVDEYMVRKACKKDNEKFIDNMHSTNPVNPDKLPPL